MPKMKTKKSAAKRFKITGSGKISYNQCGNRHLSTKKNSKRKRHLRQDKTLSSAMTKRTKKMLNG
tara:strand:+ start:1293 stop:1487 length:195 start_codon:yes stop_codon:yes gene_type:complete